MRFRDTKPFVRYVRYLDITKNTFFDNVLPLDARIFYVKSGICKIRVDSNEIKLNKGGLCYINSAVEYTILPSEVKLLAINFDFTSDFEELSNPLQPIPKTQAENFSPLEYITFEEQAELDRYLVIENCFDLESSLVELEQEYSKKSPFYVIKNSALLIEILVEILRKSELSYGQEVRFDAEKIAAYIRSHYRENIDNKVLGDIFHFHPNYLSNEFCRYFGKPLHKYLLEQRILRSVALLETGGFSISEIAFSVGFSDANYFSRYFKNIMGISPKKYIKNTKTAALK